MSRPRILIVDDEQHIVSLLSMTLGRQGYDVVTASNGPKALELAAVYELDLVILDHSMPGMNGIELSNQLRPELPVLMVTARPQILDDTEHRITNVMHKPFSPRDLVAKVVEMIGPGISPKEQSA